MNSFFKRQIEFLVPSTVTFVAVLGVVAFSSCLPLLPGFSKPCGLRVATGYPCLACGGTRSVQALASGDVIAAAKFNPLVFTGICVAGLWFAVSLWRAFSRNFPIARSEDTEKRRRRRVRWLLSGLGLAAILNWIYLVKYLPA
jgi:hypothetical protein